MQDCRKCSDRPQKREVNACNTESRKAEQRGPWNQKGDACWERIPRILIAAPASGSGKTMVTCGLMELLRQRGMSLVSFKCGPDYIDPAFHSYVLGIRGYNLDSFFLEDKAVEAFFRQKAKGRDLAVIEGVMGYYDGIAGTSTRASTYDIARITDTPVILVADGKKCSLSMAALVKGFVEYRQDSRIAGVILNRTSPAMEERLRPCLEEVGVACLGAVPECDEARLESRHLGLTLPWEQGRLRDRMARLADRLEKCLDVDGILALAGAEAGHGAREKEAGYAAAEAEAVYVAERVKAGYGTSGAESGKNGSSPLAGEGAGQGSGRSGRRIAVAMDEAFCFYYQENLDFLMEHGWELVPFSPIRDKCVPEHVDALLLGGGYPECYARELSGNQQMLQAVREAAAGGVKLLAECGGFLYLHKNLEGLDKTMYPMVGLIPADGFSGEKLSRFGYVILERSQWATDLLEEKCSWEEGASEELSLIREEGPSGGLSFIREEGPSGELSFSREKASCKEHLPSAEVIRGHEFHYWDSTRPGNSMTAKKPSSPRQWPCMYVTGQMMAGFPHLYYPSGPSWILDFLEGKKTGNRSGSI